MAGLFDEWLTGVVATGRDAERRARARDPRLTGWLDESDAARHVAASAEAAWRLGNLPAQAFGVLNEAKHGKLQPGTLMDLQNNALGAEIGASLTPEQVYARMAETGQGFDSARQELIAELAVGWSQTPAIATYTRGVRVPEYREMSPLELEMALPQRPTAFIPRSGMFADQLNWLTRPRW